MELKNFIKRVEDACAGSDNASDTVSLARKVAGKVNSFLSENGMGSISTEGLFELDRGFGEASLASLDADNIVSLVKQAGISERFQSQAAASVATILHRHSTSKDFSRLRAAQTNRAEANGTVGLIGVESLLPASIRNEFSVSTETFGMNSDKVASDMQTAITISLMKWHNTLTPRVLSNIATPDPAVLYIREEAKIYDLEDLTTEDISIVDLYADPSAVSNELTKIVPLNANDTSDDVVVADGILAFNKEANLVALSVSASKFGHAKYNRTDIVADNVKFESIRLTINDGDGNTDTFVVAIPASRGRLTRQSNAAATARSANFSYTAVMTVATTTVAGVVSDALTTILGATDDKLVLTFNIACTCDIRNGLTQALASVKAAVTSSANGDADAATIAALADATITNIGYTLDARFSEENNRKSSIAATIERRQLMYEIPQGRNFFIDVPVNSPKVDNTRNTANLYSVVRIGQDNVSLNTILAVLQEVGVMTAAYAASGSASDKPGNYYAAGGRVRPTYVSGTLSLAGLELMSDEGRQEAIEGRVLTYLKAIISKILTESFHNQQLLGDQPVVFRLITSGHILANVVGAKPGMYSTENGNGIELTLKLPSGVILECVTTTFTSMTDKIVLIPMLPNDPTSELNFGHNRDYGTIVGSFTHSADGSTVDRQIANVRELPVPTNAIGAIIDVTGVEAVTIDFS